MKTSGRGPGRQQLARWQGPMLHLVVVEDAEHLGGTNWSTLTKACCSPSNLLLGETELAAVAGRALECCVRGFSSSCPPGAGAVVFWPCWAGRVLLLSSWCVLLSCCCPAAVFWPRWPKPCPPLVLVLVGVPLLLSSSCPGLCPLLVFLVPSCCSLAALANPPFSKSNSRCHCPVQALSVLLATPPCPGLCVLLVHVFGPFTVPQPGRGLARCLATPLFLYPPPCHCPGMFSCGYERNSDAGMPCFKFSIILEFSHDTYPFAFHM